ncbi:MAG: hypothetical protein U5Q44_02710 [Dehalococcoidia bacterium]|nr:hypothetical protein [Dehalococcoidia bacterium]
MELFGEVDDPSIEVMEVKYDGEWHAYEVSQPGFFVRIPGTRRSPIGIPVARCQRQCRPRSRGKVAIPHVCPPWPDVAAVKVARQAF